MVRFDMTENNVETSYGVRRHSFSNFILNEHFPFKLGILTAYRFKFTSANYHLSKNFVNGAIKPFPLLFDHPSYMSMEFSREITSEHI